MSTTTVPYDFVWVYYDNNFAWIIDNEFSMNVFRWIDIFIWCWGIPLALYGLYVWYWWALSKNIYVPPRY